ncbi:MULTISPECIES: ABC transporter ATP-binding protein [Terrisporobacter]|uniref:Sodium ABC transporter ATP-binding protein n=2 Tax=Terrisporobacter TaxID=1505652 RepID=A0A0B3VM97_9FIRM|nr:MULTISPECIES: ABC transporter ATP-binding protein [Terrisporobacter]KHS57916.1 sodium ABC transporter ATP-binding protein [Terrisporobacter othiniensis]MCC3671165.1 ABC transporter ATP-binding protein [Terrisporobacter mayombei]MCR1822594.1 ABC transporter ATP-binding protein [Terrisporobacter muris]MDU6984077.1 ABC transporter ATP-binding protein [Terrisporobacter othiniensis]MDY3373791.1 ABC transporter ATP-binding protein [Terrisporobacter othiniensis]
MNAVEIKNLEKSMGDFKLHIDSLEIKEGFVTGIIGTNGAGKTTLMKLIMNILNQDYGKIKIFGEDFDKNKKHIKELIGYLGHETLYPVDFTLEDIKSSISIFYKNWDEKLFRDYIEDFNLNLQEKYKNLSKGQKVKFDLAMILSYHPKLIILDEPTANLDPIFRGEFLQVLQLQMEKDLSTLIYCTHITSDLDKIGDYFIAMDKGKIIFNEDIENIRNNYVIVKGRKELLNEETEEVFQYVTENEFGFRGISNNKIEVQDVFGEEVLYERPKMEDILILSKGKR